MPFSENIRRLQPSATLAVSALAKQLTAQGKDIIDLSAGEPDFDTPSWIAEAGVDAIRKGQTRYTPAAGTPKLRKAIAAELSARWGREVDWQAVVVSNGAKHSLFNACFCLFGPGDQVLVDSPYWTSYPEMVTLSRAEPVFVTGSEDRGFRVTPEDLERAATPRTRGLLFSSPNNPTGSVYSREELESMARWAKERGIWLIADEIYRPIYFGNDGPAPSVLDLPADAVGSFVLVDGVSKAFAMTGWRVGFTLSPPDLAKKMEAFQSHTTSNPSTPAQEAAWAAYTHREEAEAEIRRMREAFRRRKELVTRLFDEKLPGFSYVKPEGAFYLFFRVDGLFGGENRKGSEGVCTWFLEKAGVALVPGSAFGDDRYVRLSFATSDALLEEAVERMARAVESS